MGGGRLAAECGVWGIGMPNIGDAFPSNFLKASDLGGKQVVVTVAGVKFEPVGRDKEIKPVLYFVGKQKGYVLNKTGGRKMTEITGSAMTEDWEGTAVVLYPTETEYAGETVDCIRIKAVTKSAMGKMLPTPKKIMPTRDEHDDLDVDDDGGIPF